MKVIEYAGKWVLPGELWQEVGGQTAVAVQAGPTGVWDPGAELVRETTAVSLQQTLESALF